MSTLLGQNISPKSGTKFPWENLSPTDQLVPNRLHCDAHLLQDEDVEQRMERCVCVRLPTKLPGFPETPFFACELVLVILDQMSPSFFFLPSGSFWSSPPPFFGFLNLAWDRRTLGAERIGHLIRLDSISIDWEEKNEDPLLSFTLTINTTPTWRATTRGKRPLSLDDNLPRLPPSTRSPPTRLTHPLPPCIVTLWALPALLVTLRTPSIVPRISYFYQTMPTLVLYLESSSMCYNHPLVEWLLSQWGILKHFPQSRCIFISHWPRGMK